jgi:hypothetical protein
MVDPFDDAAHVSSRSDDLDSLMREIEEITQIHSPSERSRGMQDPFVITDGVDDADSLSECTL